MSAVSSKDVLKWRDELSALEDQIDAIQEKKKTVYEKIRRDYDRRTAEGMKCAMRFLRMDARKRQEFF